MRNKEKQEGAVDREENREAHRDKRKTKRLIKNRDRNREQDRAQRTRATCSSTGSAKGPEHLGRVSGRSAGPRLNTGLSLTPGDCGKAHCIPRPHEVSASPSPVGPMLGQAPETNLASMVSLPVDA